MDKYFYPKINGNFIRTDDKESQTSGVDLKDEKATSDYAKEDINRKSLNSFVLELLFKGKNGWLISDDYYNITHYNFVWI